MSETVFEKAPHTAILKRQPEFRPPIIHRSSLQFCDFIKDEAQFGCDLLAESDSSIRYVPYCVLKRYWTPRKVNDVLREHGLSFTFKTILTRYLRTFSLLVYTGQVAHLSHFTDHNLSDIKLPLSSYPCEWPAKARLFVSLFDNISQDQWMFFPLVFNPHELEDMHLDDSVVIPILPGRRNRIANGDAAAVHIVTVHDGCNLPAANDHPKQHECQRSFAIKTYHTERSKPTYENEIKALRMFTNCPSPYIVKYQGSYRQHGACNIVLEEVEGGTLADFFEKNSPPMKNKVPLFWASLSHVLNGLERVHHLVEGDPEVFGIHEDIKPDNILISPTASSSLYDFTPKIIDFGLFSRVTRSISSSSTAMGGNTQGLWTYSSPESSYNLLHHQNEPTMVTTKADIFSIAAVLSVACAWVVGGRNLQMEYYKKRKAYHDQNPKFHDTLAGCFHDGHQCIHVVYDMHERIRHICEAEADRITPAILDILEKHVFRKENATERSAARDIYSDLDDLLRPHLEAGLSDLDTVSVRSDIDGASHVDDSLAQLGKGITLPKLASFRKEGKVCNQANSNFKAFMCSLKVNIPGRDHFFLIDDSRSMKKEAPLIKEALQELFMITKDLDPDKVELSFASAPSTITKTRRRVNKFLHAVDNNPFRREPSMLDFFPRFIHDVIKPRLPRELFGFNVNLKARLKFRKPMSIYIFTDGNWGDDADPGGGLKQPLVDLIREMQDRRIKKQHISFHFVRFGDNENGKAYLDHLDRFGQSLDGWDIVDVKDLSNEVHTILVGPLSRLYDKVGEESRW